MRLELRDLQVNLEPQVRLDPRDLPAVQAIQVQQVIREKQGLPDLLAQQVTLELLEVLATRELRETPALQVRQVPRGPLARLEVLATPELRVKPETPEPKVFREPREPKVFKGI